MGSAQDFSGCGDEKTSAGNLSSSTTQMPDPSKMCALKSFLRNVAAQHGLIPMCFQ